MAKVKKTKISLAEFKAWLEGVEDLQEDDWSPSKVQWEKIRQKIESIDEGVVNPLSQPSQPSQQSVNYQPVTYQPPISNQSAFGQPYPVNSGSIIDHGPTAGIAVNLNNPPPPGTEFI